LDTQLLSGKSVSKAVYKSLINRISALKSSNVTPGLAVVLVGEDPASQVYVENKTRKFSAMNLCTDTLKFPADTTQSELLTKILELNKDEKYHGILIQLPLPKHFDSNAILNSVDSKKDVDGFHPYNMGCLTAGKPTFIPCTPKGIMRILEHYKINLLGKHVVVVGRSNTVGRPISILTSLKQEASNATTTICHSGTQNLKHFTKQADILILALGSPEFLKRGDIKKGAVIIDVGINRVASNSHKGYKLVGDVNAASLIGMASAITPVPGGVGPMTIAMLVENTIEAAERIFD
jgi:methylenetetrahydrofolate dehydrogenase (NADP+)/methenyltetrahydrofolate cyclohydrolase